MRGGPPRPRARPRRPARTGPEAIVVRRELLHRAIAPATARARARSRQSTLRSTARQTIPRLALLVRDETPRLALLARDETPRLAREQTLAACRERQPQPRSANSAP